jgi:predicted DNA-binding protein (MmcQ/YjbR family)
MNIEAIRNYCFTKPGVTEGFPFDDVTLVIKVMGKLFLLASLDTVPLNINLKCTPELAVELRERYPSVLPGYHMNKKLWNTVVIDGSVPRKELLSWIDLSYDLVVAKLTKAQREELTKEN